MTTSENTRCLPLGVGVALPMGESASLWLRGGLTYGKLDLDNDIEVHGWLAGGEVLAVLMPVDNVGFTLGGMYEHGFSGEREWDGADTDLRLYTYGFTTGMLFAF